MSYAEITAVLEGREAWHVEAGDCLAVMRKMPDACVQTCVTSPPYFSLRSYKTPPVSWPVVRYRPMPALEEIEVPAMEADLGLEKDVLHYVRPGGIMTIEERAREALRLLAIWMRNSASSDLVEPTQIVADAIHAAVTEEREACAGVAEDLYCWAGTDPVWAQQKIASNIRARSNS